MGPCVRRDDSETLDDRPCVRRDDSETLDDGPCVRRDDSLKLTMTIVSVNHCVLATRGGVAWVMNWVASSMAVPHGVAITSPNGTRTRGSAIRTKAIFMV